MAAIFITATGSLTARNLDGQGRSERLDYDARVRAAVRSGYSLEAAERLAAAQLSGQALPVRAALDLAHKPQANRNYIAEIRASSAPAPLLTPDACLSGARIVRPAHVRYDNRRGWYEEVRPA
jgi:hypothetical protein